MKNHQYYSNSFSYDAIKNLAILSLKSEEELFERSAEFYLQKLGKQLSNIFLIKTTIKFCPSCYEVGDIIHKRDWQLTLVHYCDSHKVQLIDMCQGCESKLNFGALITGYCPCGFHLLESQVSHIETGSLFEEYQEFTYLLLEKKTAPFIIPVSLKDFLTLASKTITLLGGMSSFVMLDDLNDREIPSFTSRYQGELENERLKLAMVNIFWMYSNFPSNFYKAMDDFYQKPYTNRKYQKKQFETLFENPRFEVIQSAYEGYWNLQARKQNVHRALNEKYSDQKYNYTKKDLIKKYNLTRNEVDTLWRKPRFLKEVTRGGNTYKVFSAEFEHEINEYMLLKPHLVTRKEVCKMLKISDFLAMRLVGTQLLRCKEVLGREGYFFDIREVQKFKERYNSILHNPIFVEYGEISAAIKIIKLIKSKIISTDELSIEFLQSEFPRYEKIWFANHQLRGKQVYSLEQVRERLRVDGKAVHKMIDKGVLIPFEIRFHTESNRYYFLKEEIDLFLSVHIKIADAVLAYPVSKITLQRWVNKGILQNVLEGISNTNLLIERELKEELLRRGYILS